VARAEDPPPELRALVKRGTKVAVTYYKTFATCAHLVDANLRIQHVKNLFCVRGGPTTVEVAVTDFNATLKVGQKYRLCNGNSYQSCSPLLTYTEESLYTVTPLATNVAITPGPLNVARDGRATFQVTANAGFALLPTVQTDCAAGSWTASAYTTGPITASCSVRFKAVRKSLYVLGGEVGSTLSHFVLDNLGVATPLGSPLFVGEGPSSMVWVDPAGAFAYVVSNSGVYQYALDESDGHPTPAASFPYGAKVSIVNGKAPATFDRAGRTYYAASPGLRAFDVDAGTGALVDTGMAAPVRFEPDSIVTHPNGGLVFVLSHVGSTCAVSTFKVDRVKRELTELYMHSFSGVMTSFNIDRAGNFIHLTSDNGTILTLAVDAASGVLTPAAQPFSFGAPAYALSLTFNSAGTFAYLLDVAANRMVVLPANPTNGTFGNATQTYAVNGPTGFALDASGKTAYLTSYGYATLSQLTVAANGTLSLRRTVPAGSQPRGIAVRPSK